MDTNVENKLIHLICQNSKADGMEINDETNLVNDLGFDSMDLMVMISDIECEFNILFDPDNLDYEKVINFQGLYNSVIDIIHKK